MCGIAGALDARVQTGASDLEELGWAMAARLAHRGPDDAGVWRDERAGVVLAHRRLSIIDLSQDGAQPMRSADGRYLVSYNGEIYNHLSLRSELERAGRAFRGRSDTEVLLESVCEWGLERTLERLNGMFAFALYDRVERRLHLARDRMGEKPLYYGWFGGGFAFASELKAIRAHPAFEAEIDRGSLALYMRYGYVPEPFTIYRGIQKLPPGTFLTVPAGADAAATAPRRYWSVGALCAEGLAAPFRGDEREAVDELDALLRDAVHLRMCADVPLGAFLSGGIDSSTVVAMMQAQSPRPVETFAIGFQERDFDEASYARAVAQHLGTNHHELYLTARDALDAVPDMAQIYDEPFSDPSQIPTYLLARFTRTRVTVSLSGDGGDELFWGYDRYAHALSIWERLQRIPGGARAMVGLLGRSRAASAVLRRAPARWGWRAVVELAPAPDFRSLYRGLVSRWRERVVVGGEEPPTPFTEAPEGWPRSSPDQPVLLDLLTYLPEDILTKVDRASMAVSLESRVPLLDPRLVRFALRLPAELKRRGGVTKWILRQVLDRYVPRRLVERPKRGFSAPIGAWMRGELRPWAVDLLDGPRLRREGFLDAGLVEGRLADHLRGRGDWEWPLWSALMFESWLEAQAKPAPALPQTRGSPHRIRSIP
ncbi:MAG TPA: asparagine synthase (glutamine-hydrolyzing) [Anaeromyxobacteraceae bacterium]|jgi:asparagine synthase (glutamine-hydrolysing)|nr:asparagine synthase (glutamine-hydrolyzing) [Anaeromyxobacteraceae bacterium]